jgi:hypothetical protein
MRSLLYFARSEVFTGEMPLPPSKLARNGDGTFSFQKANHRGHRMLWRERDAYRHMIRHHMAFHSIIKFFQVDITGMFRMTSSARYFKEGVGSSRPS